MAFLFVWLLQEMGDDLTRYVGDLHERFMMAWDIAEGLLSSGEEEEEAYIPLPNALEDITDNVWIEETEARELYRQLFPHGDSVQRDFQSVACGLAVVALHSAIETYAKALEIDIRRTSLPRAVEKALREKTNQLDAESMQNLVELDETRHVVVHNRGVVDSRYVNHVPYNKLIEGEFRQVSIMDLHRYAKTVWRIAMMLRAAAGRS